MARQTAGPRIDWGHWMFLAPAFVFLSVFAALPFVELVRMSLSDATFGGVVRGDWNFVGLDNFASLPGNPDFRLATVNTLVFTAVVVVLSLAGGLAVATLIARTSLPRGFLQGMIVLSWSMPAVITGNVWRFMFSPDGVVNKLGSFVGMPAQLWLADPQLALYSVSFVAAWQAIPFAALVYKAALMDIPPEQIEAAAIDGATPRQTFWRVVVPQLRPVTLVLVILLMVYALRSFDHIFIMTQGGPGTATTTVPLLAYRTAFSLDNFGLGSAISVIASVLIVFLALAYTRAAAQSGGRA
jgi:multiple sugar transport system permease protein